MRIVSLAPFVSETLFALGIDKEIVGLSLHCTVPRGRQGPLMRCGAPKAPSLDAIRETKADLVLLSGDFNNEEHIAKISQTWPTADFRPRSLADAASFLIELGKLVGRQEEGEDLSLKLNAEILRIATDLDTLPPLAVFLPIQKDPWLSIGHSSYPHSLLASCAANNIFGNSDDLYPEFTPDQVHLRNLDAILLPDDAFTVEDKMLMKGAPRLSDCPVRIVDHRMLRWPGVRSIEALDGLHRVLTEIRLQLGLL